MAQKTKALSTRARLLARRYGLIGKTGVAIACVALIAVVTAVGVFSARSSGVVILRGEESPKTEGLPSASDSPKTFGGNETASPTPNPKGEDSSEAMPTCVVVHIDGAVTAPGVYEIQSDTPRMNDAVVLAGGLTADADTTAINLAAPVADGQKLHVPAIGEQEQVPQTPTQQVPTPNQASGPNERGTDVASDTHPTTDPANNGQALVNINTATNEELQTLVGIGEATAGAIIEDRERNGAFATPEDLMRVSGIGDKKFAKIRGSICV